MTILKKLIYRMEVLIMKNEIMLFENQEVKLEVNVKDETVWLSLDQMSNFLKGISQ